LFGYTEEARQVKKTVSVTTGQRRKWDKESFFIDARERLTEKEAASIKQLFEKSQELKCEFSWGTGKTGSFSAKWPHLGPFSVYSVFSDGRLTINYGSFNKAPEQHEFIAYLKESLANMVGVSAPVDYERRYPNYQISDWSEKDEQLLAVLESVLGKFPAPDHV
jgi:hypothetical protein